MPEPKQKKQQKKQQKNSKAKVRGKSTEQESKVH